MEGPLPAPGVHSQLNLGLLVSALLMASESLTRVLGFHLLPWGALVSVVWLLWVLRRWHIVRRGKVPCRKCAACDEVCGQSRETGGSPTAQADRAPEPPNREPGPPVGHTLCLSALNTHLRGSSHQDTGDLVGKAQESRAPQHPRVTDDRPGLGASEKSGGQCCPKAVSNLNGNTLVAEHPGLLAQELARWKQKVQEKEEEKERLQEVNAQRQQELEALICQVEALGEQLLRVFPVPDLLGGRGGDGDVEPAGRAPVQQPKGVLKKVGAGGDLCVSLPGLEPQPQGRDRQEETEERWRFARLVRETVRLQREQAALWGAAFQLEHDVQLLKHKLQVLPGQHAWLLAELQERELEAETRCLELERRLPAMLEDLAAQEEARNIYREMAECLGRELEVSVTFHHKQTLFQERMVWESWMAAEQTWRKVQELRSSNACLRQELAADLAPSRPCPQGPGAPATALEAPWLIGPPRSGRLGGFGRQASLDSAPASSLTASTTPKTHVCL